MRWIVAGALTVGLFGLLRFVNVAASLQSVMLAAPLTLTAAVHIPPEMAGIDR